MSFDTLAPYYRAMEFVSAGGLLQRCRTAFLHEAAQCRRALLVGEGPGRFLAALLRANPGVEVTCVESSARMIQKALQQVKREGLSSARVRFEQSDALQWEAPPRRFDLVVTHFFLDCFRPEELAAVIANIAVGTTEQARWLLADFRLPDRGWRRWRAQAGLALMYAFFRWATSLSATRLTPPDRFLRAAGFVLAGRRSASFGLAHSDLWIRVAA